MPPNSTRRDAIEERFNWASKHLIGFETACNKFVRGPPRPYDITFDRKTEDTDTIDSYKFVIREHPPPRLSFMVGDVIHGLRSVLDNLAYGLAESGHKGRLPSAIAKDAAFPIATRIKDFDTRKIGAVAPEVVTIIEALQPYHRPDNPSLHPLAQLNRLSNTDKHRHLHMVFYRMGNVGWLSQSFELLRFITRPKDNTEIAAFKWLIPADPEMEVDPQFKIQIAFSESRFEDPRGAAGLLQRIADFIEGRVMDPLLPLL